MILDERNEFADNLALSTAATGRALVGDVIDLEVARNIANGRPLYLVVQVSEVVTSAGAATVSFELASDAQAAIAVDGSATVHHATAAIPKATLVAGYNAIMIALPLEGPVYERYLGIIANVGVAALTAGKVNAFLTTNPKTWKALKSATGV